VLILWAVLVGCAVGLVLLVVVYLKRPKDLSGSTTAPVRKQPGKD